MLYTGQDSGDIVMMVFFQLLWMYAMENKKYIIKKKEGKNREKNKSKWNMLGLSTLEN